MPNPQKYVYTPAGARTVQAKGDIADLVVRIAVEETPLFSFLPHQSTQDIHPQIPEQDLRAIDTANAHAHGSVAPAAQSTARTLNDNYTQYFRKTVEVSRHQMASAQYGVTNEFAEQTMLRTIEQKKDIEATILSDQVAQAPTPANARTGNMAGISTLITTNTDAVGDFNQANFETLVRGAYITSGGNPTICYMDGTRKNAVASWTEQVTRYQQSDPHRIFNNVQYFESNIGNTFEFRLHRYMPQDFVGTAAVCIALDMENARWVIREYLPWSLIELAQTGVGRSSVMDWDGTILCGAEKANFAFVG